MFSTIKLQHVNIFLQVIVKEAKNQSHLTTASVLLKLIDMNDNNPLFEENSYTFYINENSNYSTDVGHIEVIYILDMHSHSIVSIKLSKLIENQRLSGGNNQEIMISLLFLWMYIDQNFPHARSGYLLFIHVPM